MPYISVEIRGHCSNCNSPVHYVTNSIEAHQAPPEPDSTACCPAGCGAVEHVTAGRCPDRERFAKLKTIIQNKRDFYADRQPQDEFDFGVLYASEIFLKHISDLDPGEASG